MSLTLLEQVTAATAGEYEVVAELGDSSAGAAFLAREIGAREIGVDAGDAGDDSALVVLLLPPGATDLAVLAAIGENVPASAGTCTTCGVAPPTWSATCPRCGHGLAGGGRTDERFTVADVQSAITSAYVLLGLIPHHGTGGLLVFARDRVDHHLVALTATRHASGDSVLEAVWESWLAITDPSTGRPAAAPFASAPAASGGQAVGRAVGHAESETHAEAGHQALADGRGEHAAPTAFAPTAFAPPPRRPWVPVVVLGVGALVAAGAWIAWQGTAGRAATPLPLVVDSSTTVSDSLPATAAPAETSSGLPGAATMPATESTAVALERPPLPPMMVVIDGELPANWTRTVNGRFGGSNRTIQLRVGTSALIQVDAPGYCPDTFRVQLAPGTTQHWTPRLRGVPMVGGC